MICKATIHGWPEYIRVMFGEVYYADIKKGNYFWQPTIVTEERLRNEFVSLGENSNAETVYNLQSKATEIELENRRLK